MNRKIIRMIIAGVFAVSGICYFLQSEYLFGALFLVVGALFGYRAVKGTKEE